MSEDSPVQVALLAGTAGAARLEECLQGAFEVVHRGTAKGATAPAPAADVAVLDLEAGAPLSQLEGLLAAWPQVPVVVVTGDEEVGHLRRILALGARDFLLRPLEARSVARVVRRVGRRGQARRELRAQAEAQGEGLPGSGTWLVTAGAAGVGRTTLALGLANELSLLGGEVVVADLDLGVDDVGYYLGLPSGRPDLGTLLSALEEAGGDPSAIDPAEVLRRHPSGLAVVTGFEDATRGGALDPAGPAAVLAALRECGTHLVVDLPPGLPAWLDLGALDGAQVLVVGAEGLGPERALRGQVDAVLAAGVPAERVLVAVTRRGEEDPARTERIREALARRAVAAPAFLPDDRVSAEGAVRAGQPVSRVFAEGRLGDGIRRTVARWLKGAGR